MDTPKLEHEYRETSINANGQQFVRVQEYIWDEDGAKVEAKNGFIEVKAGKGAELAQKLRDGKRIAVFGPFSARQGNFQVTLLPSATIIATAQAAATSPTLEHS